MCVSTNTSKRGRTCIGVQRGSSNKSKRERTSNNSSLLKSKGRRKHVQLNVAMHVGSKSTYEKTGLNVLGIIIIDMYTNKEL